MSPTAPHTQEDAAHTPRARAFFGWWPRSRARCASVLCAARTRCASMLCVHAVCGACSRSVVHQQPRDFAPFGVLFRMLFATMVLFVARDCWKFSIMWGQDCGEEDER